MYFIIVVVISEIFNESISMVARYNRIFHFPVFSMYVQLENSLLIDPLLFYSFQFWPNWDIRKLQKDSFAVLLLKQLHLEIGTHTCSEI